MEDEKGIISSLFDFSFRHFVTPRVIGILYGVLLIFTAIGAIAMIAIMFMMHPGYGVLALLVLAPLFFFLSVLSYRVGLELIIAIHRMRHELADMHRIVTRDETAQG